MSGPARRADPGPRAGRDGAARGEGLGTRLLSYVRPAGRTTCVTFLKEAFAATTPASCEVALVKGRWRAEVVELVASPAASGRDLGHAGPQARIALVDVSRRRKTEEALRESERRHGAVVAAMAEGVVVFDARGGIESCNTAAERILDATAAELCGRRSLDGERGAIREDGSPFAPEDQPAAVVLRTGNAQWNVIVGLPRDAGTAWIRASAEPMRDADGRVRGVVNTLEDVTEARSRDAEIRESRARLDRVLAANPKEVESYRGGKAGLLSFFVGQIMKETKGKANPKSLQEVLRKKLGRGE